MKEYIFKVIWMPMAVIVAICCTGILGMLLKEVGWEQPFRWVFFIGLLAFIADRAVNP